jgi:beta-lactamase regulating signal transducer with metallopeptidase domain
VETLLHLGPATAASLVSALISAVWEGAVLACCAWLCLRLLPGLSAAARSAVWMNVFLLLVVLHGLPALGTHGTSEFAVHHAPFELSMKWSLVIAGVWGTLSMLRAVQLVVSVIHARGMVSRATPVDVDPELRTLLRIRGNKNGGRTAELCTSPEVERPSVFGFFRPRVLLPEALRARLTPSELQQVVLHEMEHLRRGDDWTNLLQKIALVIFPVNPALLWVERQLCAERELACDDGVLRANAGRKAYAICLTRLAEYSMLRRNFSLVLGAWERQSELVRRVHRILRTSQKTLSPRQTAMMTTSLIVGVLGCALGLSRSPQLVSFDISANAAQAQLETPAGMPSVAELASAAVAHRETAAGAQMVNAVMPQAVGSSAAHTANGVAKPVTRPLALRTVKRKKTAATQQAWVLMTTWNENDLAPSVVLTVAQIDPQTKQNQAASLDLMRNQKKSNPAASSHGIDDRIAIDPTIVHQPTYAAVPFGNGWLFIQI